MIFLDLDNIKWVTDAVCASTDPDVFFPEHDSSNSAAKKVCFSCPVQTECLEYALIDPRTIGIWGGTTHVQRRKIRRERKQEYEQSA